MRSGKWDTVGGSLAIAGTIAFVLGMLWVMPAFAADKGGPNFLELPADDGPTKSWTGFYMGVHAGHAWGNADVTDTNGGVPPGPFSYDPKGFLGGATAGYNLQFKNIVAGVEVELGYMDLAGDGRLPSSNPKAYQTIWLDGGFYGVAAGRLGVAVGRTLIYGKGGWAYFDGEAGQTTTNPGYKTHSTGAFTGYVYGGGVEHMLSDRVSIKFEYLRFDFGSEGGYQESVSDHPIGYRYKNTTDLTADTVKLGVNFKF